MPKEAIYIYMKPQLDTKTKRLIATLPSSLDSSNVGPITSDFEKTLKQPEVTAADWDTLEIDMSATQRIDSIGLNMLLRLSEQIETRSAKMKLIVTSPLVHDTLLATRMDKIGEIIMQKS